jgi:hypothetical protein
MGTTPPANSPHFDMLGGHTFRVSYQDGGGTEHENVAICNKCHAKKFGNPQVVHPKINGGWKPLCATCHSGRNPANFHQQPFIQNANCGQCHTMKAWHPKVNQGWKQFCNVCHSSQNPTVSKFDHQGYSNFGDYDGDGVIEGIQSEVQGLLDIVLAKLLSTGVTQLPSRPYWGSFSADPAKADVQHATKWNYSLIKSDGSRGVHNPQFAVALLQLTYTRLSQTFGGNTFAQDFPNASLR